MFRQIRFKPGQIRLEPGHFSHKMPCNTLIYKRFLGYQQGLNLLSP